MSQHNEAHLEAAEGPNPAHRLLESGNTIKLVVLHPGTSSDTLSCDLVTCDLDQSPDYEALSYTWDDENGDRSLTQEIWCGPEHGKLLVSKNCEAALLRLRLDDDPRFLWVDALCIDRSQVRERSHQVYLVPQIYHTASRVVVFLGPRSFESDRLFDYLNGPRTNTPTPEEEAGELTKDLLKRSWFKRLWALQEIVLARAAIIVCGDKTIRWQTLSKFFFAESVGDEPLEAAPFWDIHHPAAMLLRGGLQGPQSVDVLPKLFRASWSLKASEPLDNIFAVLGLVEKDSAATVLPDYGKSVFEILYELAVYLLKRFRIIFPPGPWVLRDVQYASSTSPPHTWIYRWNGKGDPGDPIYLAEEAVVDNHLLTIRGQKMLRGFFDLSQEPLPLLRFRLDGDKIYEVSGGTVMVLDEATKPAHEDGGFIAVKVAENSGVILRSSGASDAYSLVAGFSNPRRSRITTHHDTSESPPASDWLEDTRSFTIF